jgi:hypothetical protein
MNAGRALALASGSRRTRFQKAHQQAEDHVFESPVRGKIPA